MAALARPIPENAVHLCLDMQNLLRHDGPWPVAWAEPALNNIIQVLEVKARNTVFTRFVPPRSPTDMRGTWQGYYQRWRNVTRDFIDPAALELVAPLPKFVPPALVLDKMQYSAFFQTNLHDKLSTDKVDTIVVTGAETDVCVLSTICSAVDFGYRIVVASDGVCSSSDKCHDALLTLYTERFTQQLEIADVASILNSWLPA